MLAGLGSHDAPTAQKALATTAAALARALPVEASMYDPDLDGPPMSAEEIKAAAVAARFFLTLVADLFGDPANPSWLGSDFAFAAALKRRPDWKPPAEPTPAQKKRRAAAARVYALMAEHCCDTGQPPKQEAAIAAVAQEYGLARSKIMQGLKEYRQGLAWLYCTRPAADPSEGMEEAHSAFLRAALEKEQLKRSGPHDTPD